MNNVYIISTHYITLDIDHNVKRHSMNSASQNTVMSPKKYCYTAGRHIVIREDIECVT